MINYNSSFVLKNLSDEILTDYHRLEMDNLIGNSLYYMGAGNKTNGHIDISITYHSIGDLEEDSRSGPNNHILVKVVIIYGSNEKSAEEVHNCLLEGFISKSLSPEEKSLYSFVESLGVTPDFNRHLKSPWFRWNVLKESGPFLDRRLITNDEQPSDEESDEDYSQFHVPVYTNTDGEFSLLEKQLFTKDVVSFRGRYQTFEELDEFSDETISNIKFKK
jgi:hypothetical protein